ncbi:MAG: hypothetical protein WAT09_18755 [Paracoccaceae bacterium]
MPRFSPLFVLLFGLSGFPAGAESDAAVEGEAVSNDYAEGVISVDGVDYKVGFYLSGAEPTLVNGRQMVTEKDLPLSVDISRADGPTMADLGYVVREVLDAACRLRGFVGDPSVMPTLSPAGQWVFSAGCLF